MLPKYTYVETHLHFLITFSAKRVGLRVGPRYGHKIAIGHTTDLLIIRYDTLFFGHCNETLFPRKDSSTHM
jgi:hypothetical protein